MYHEWHRALFYENISLEYLSVFKIYIVNLIRRLLKRFVNFSVYFWNLCNLQFILVCLESNKTDKFSGLENLKDWYFHIFTNTEIYIFSLFWALYHWKKNQLSDTTGFRPHGQHFLCYSCKKCIRPIDFHIKDWDIFLEYCTVKWFNVLKAL